MLDQQAHLDVYNASPLKQQSDVDMSQPALDLTLQSCMLSGEAAYTKLIVSGMTRETSTLIITPPMRSLDNNITFDIFLKLLNFYIVQILIFPMYFIITNPTFLSVV